MNPVITSPWSGAMRGGPQSQRPLLEDQVGKEAWQCFFAFSIKL